MLLLPWPAYSQNMSLIEQLWDLVGRLLARDPRPTASKDELWLRIQAILNSLPQAYTQNVSDSTPCRIAGYFNRVLEVKVTEFSICCLILKRKSQPDYLHIILIVNRQNYFKYVHAERFCNISFGKLF